MATPTKQDLMKLPDNLPAPQDDGAGDHLTGLLLPSIALKSTLAAGVDLSLLRGRNVVYAYPMSARPDVPLPAGWDQIPGARGCTPQAVTFEDQKDVVRALGADVYGLSTQGHEDQREFTNRIGLSFPLLSDADFKLTDALRLPTMEVEGIRMLKRITLIIRDGVIEKIFYPVFPSTRAAGDVIEWLRQNPLQTERSREQTVTLYTKNDCAYCLSAKQLLQRRDIRYVEINVENEPNAMLEMVAKSGRRTVPQIFLGESYVGSAEELLQVLNA